MTAGYGICAYHTSQQCITLQTFKLCKRLCKCSLFYALHASDSNITMQVIIIGMQTVLRVMRFGLFIQTYRTGTKIPTFPQQKGLDKFLESGDFCKTKKIEECNMELIIIGISSGVGGGLGYFLELYIVDLILHVRCWTINQKHVSNLFMYMVSLASKNFKSDA